MTYIDPLSLDARSERGGKRESGKSGKDGKDGKRGIRMREGEGWKCERARQQAHVA
jgi:hypothetical protein